MRNLNITGCSRIQEILILHKLSNIELPTECVDIAFHQNIEQGKGDCMWYGGEVVSIRYGKHDFVISAYGDVRSILIRKKDNLEIISVHDKYSKGEFREAMSPYIKNDAQLHAIMCDNDEEYELNLMNNNWYELIYVDDEGQYHDLEFSLDSSVIYDAIAEAISAIPEYINEFEREEKLSE